MILNKKHLLKGNVRGRRLVLKALEAALEASDPRKAVMKSVRVKGDTLYVEKEGFRFDSIYVIGAGKASGYMAEAINKILGDKIKEGFVIIPDYLNLKLKTGKIKLWKGTHPIPDHKSVEGTKRMLDVVSNSKKGDLVICLLSGGGSSLMTLPPKDIMLKEKQEVTRKLMNAGATIHEINTVRKHLSDIKGGRLAERLQNSMLISLIISDVVGNAIDTIASGPTAPDNTTFKDAKRILQRYDLWHSNIRRHIEKGIEGEIPDTPKPSSNIFKNVRNVVIASNEIACNAAKESLKINAKILTTQLQGEAKEVGRVIASIGREIAMNNRTFKKPVAIIAGGETTVKVRGKGRGGRNQELVLSACRDIAGLNIVIASIGTDGIDGNSDAAGAIADSFTLSRALKRSLDPEIFLINNNSNAFFTELGDAIITGATGTNVNDVLVMACI